MENFINQLKLTQLQLKNSIKTNFWIIIKRLYVATQKKTLKKGCLKQNTIKMNEKKIFFSIRPNKKFNF